jgi:hypothetical protein
MRILFSDFFNSKHIIFDFFKKQDHWYPCTLNLYSVGSLPRNFLGGSNCLRTSEVSSQSLYRESRSTRRNHLFAFYKFTALPPHIPKPTTIASLSPIWTINDPVSWYFLSKFAPGQPSQTCLHLQAFACSLLQCLEVTCVFGSA